MTARRPARGWVVVEGESITRSHHRQGPAAGPDQIIAGAGVERLGDTDWFRVMTSVVRSPWDEYRQSLSSAVQETSHGVPTRDYAAAARDAREAFAELESDQTWHLRRALP